METYYTSERNAQILLYLLKKNGIKKVVASPGTTNITMVASMQQDPWFEMYSVADERSAAYMACGMSVESGEPVVLSCTGATASRNYISGLTEAYYRKIPILAITATQVTSNVGNLVPQVIDRSQIQKDIAVYSTCIRVVKDSDDEWNAIIKANKSMQYLRKQGGGPVHIDLETQYGDDFSVKELPSAKFIKYYEIESELPQITAKRVSVFIGAHAEWSDIDTNLVDKFCAKYNGVVLCDHSSNYHGKYAFHGSILGQQEFLSLKDLHSDLCIHIGEVTGSYPLEDLARNTDNVWRVSKDGEIKDRFKKLDAVFEMSEHFFFRHYVEDGNDIHTDEFLDRFNATYQKIYDAIPENIPFSNIWIAKTLAPLLTENSVLHLGVLNSIRSWNMFKIPSSICGYANVGGFGIDGGMSSMIGSSFIHPNKVFYGIFGDLAFFYDMNSIANRHIGNNLRIMLINNGRGTEFRNYNHPGARFGNEADKYIAAAGHYGGKSPFLVKHYAEDLGFKYLSASNKEEFMKIYQEFLTPDMSRSVLMEIFTNSQDESQALYMINTIIKSENKLLSHNGIKMKMKKVIGKKGVEIISILKNK